MKTRPVWVKLATMEEVLPPQTAHGAGFERTHVRQFTVFLENRVGRLQMLLRALEDVTRVVALAIEESADSALVRLICADPDAAREALKHDGFAFAETDLLCVALPAKTRHPLAATCTALLAAEINIHYLYPLLTAGTQAIALSVEDPTLAARLLISKGFDLLGEGDLKA
jgi:hypothetical protein